MTKAREIEEFSKTNFTTMEIVEQKGGKWRGLKKMYEFDDGSLGSFVKSPALKVDPLSKQRTFSHYMFEEYIEAKKE